MRCANCGAQFTLGSTFISLADCETLIAAADDGSSLVRRHRGDRR